MKKNLAFLLALCLLAAFVLCGCGEKPVFGVSTNEDNSISVTADRGAKDSAGLGYLTVGENEQVVLEAHFQTDGEIEVQLRAGLLGSEDFPEEPSAVVTIVGEGTESFTLEPGEYTVTVKALNKLSGTALIRTEPVG